MMRRIVKKRVLVGALAMLVTWLTSNSWTIAQTSADEAIRPQELARWTTVGYWIGVRCTDSGTPTEPKVIVGEIIAEAPAAKAGIETGDHITLVDKEQLKSVEHLAKLVHASQGRPIRVTVVRANHSQPLVLNITPEERPTANYNVPLGKDPEELADEIFRQAKSRLRPGINLRLVSPSIVIPSRQPELPADTEFIIKRSDGKTRIVVRQESNEWIVSPDNLGELPEETRRWAAQLQNLINGRYGLVHSIPTGFNVVVPQTFSNQPQTTKSDQVEQLQQQIRELQQTLEELRAE